MAFPFPIHKESSVKHPVTIAVVCLARKTYDYEAARQLYSKIRQDLKKIEDVQWCFIDELVISQKTAWQLHPSWQASMWMA